MRIIECLPLGCQRRPFTSERIAVLTGAAQTTTRPCKVFSRRLIGFTLKQLLAVVIPAVLSLSASLGLGATGKPNVLLIISDDLRDTLGCYGNTAIKTPNIDRLATQGVRFNHAYVQYSVCNPSRASFLTGLRSEQTKIINNMLMFRDTLPDIVTLPQLLKENGWYSAGYGKVYHLAGNDDAARKRWMDLPKSWDEADDFKATPAGKVIEGCNITGGVLPWCQWGMTAGEDDDQPDGQTAAHCIKVIEQQTAAGKPWIVAAGFHRPHDPFLSPKKYFDLYPKGSMQIYHDPPDASPLPPLAIEGGGFRKAFDAFTEQDRQEFQRAYYAGVSFTDAQVGRLMGTLDRLKLWDDTLVIFIGDNGYHHNERNWWNKHTLFECSCRVPMIIVPPKSKTGTVYQHLVEFVDLYPTVIDYCGLKAPHQLTGESLRARIENPATPGKPAAYTLVTRGGGQYGQAVRTEHWRFILWTDGNRELYDELNDPKEMHNLADSPEQGGNIADLGKLLAVVGPFEPFKKQSTGSAKNQNKSVN